MKKISCPNSNESSLDRMIRFILSVIFAYLAWINFAGLQLLLAIIALILFATSVTGICLIYKLLGVSTCPKK